MYRRLDYISRQHRVPSALAITSEVDLFCHSACFKTYKTESNYYRQIAWPRHYTAHDFLFGRVEHVCVKQ